MEILTPRNLFPGASYQVHYQRAARGWEFRQHGHRGFSELCYVLAGSVDHVFPVVRRQLTAGDLLLIREEDIHELRGRDFHFCNVNVPDAAWRDLASYLGDLPALAQAFAAVEPPVYTVPARDRPRLEAGFATLFARQCQGDAPVVLKRFLVEVVLDHLLRPARPAPSTSAPPWLADLLEAGGERALAGCDPRALARLAGKSAEHLARSFRSHLGTTPTEWLNRLRLERAALRLSHTNEPILAIALDLGFEHLGYFYRLFKRCYGLAPRAYRRRHGVAGVG
jgi:AraC family cel operon transcriptional repressor